jgi:hypothetical protein
MGSNKVQLGSLNKEMVMFDVGYHTKQEVMDEVESRIGDKPDGETTVYINYFGNVTFMRDIAQANNQFREGDLVNIEELGNRIFKKNMLRIGLEESSWPED